MSAAAFEELGICGELVTGVDSQGWTIPTPIQAECVPLVLGGGDVLAAAETGSGKTGAFALPIIQVVHETRQQSARLGSRKTPTVLQTPGSTPGIGCQLNPEDRDVMLAVSEDGRVCQSRSERSWCGCRGTKGVFSGRHYFEVVVSDEGLCRVGWSTRAAKLELGTCSFGFGYGGTSKKSNGRKFEDYGEPFGLSDVIGCAIDFDKEEIWFSKNGKRLGKAFDLPKKLLGQPFYPAVCLKNAELSVRFGGGGKGDALRYLGSANGFGAIAKATRDQSASLETEDRQSDPSSSSTQPLALVLEPTRDLAEQTFKCFKDLAAFLELPSVECALLVGGIDASSQAKCLRRGVDVVVGTPMRVKDFAESGKLKLQSVRFYVLDEADRLVDDGETRKIVSSLFNRIPKAGLSGTERLQCLMFSATLHSDAIKRIAEELCQNPIWVDLKGKHSVPETVHHLKFEVDPEDDRSWLQKNPEVWTDSVHCFDTSPGPNNLQSNRDCLSEAVKRLKPRVLKRIIDELDMDQCLIFCRTNFDCDLVEKFLNNLGGGKGFRGKMEKGLENPYSCLVLAGARSMHERREALQSFKDGDVRFLICTDVAARGIDIKELPYVINMTLPDMPQIEDYIHRVGRVGRAETMGLAISIVSKVPEKVWYCTQKGYKPWFNPKKKDTLTNKEGGHTKWYDEQEILRAIEKRLKRKVDTLNDDMSLPQSIASGGGKIQYGQQKESEVSVEAAKRVQKLRPTVQVLADLEVQAQRSFFDLRQRWA